MADAPGLLSYETPVVAVEKPPLDLGLRLRLSVMMFLEFAIWGSWFTVYNLYCLKPVAAGGLGFTGTQVGSIYGTMALGAIFSTMLAGQLADRVMASEWLMAISHLLGAGLLYAMAQIHDYNTLWWVALAYALVYNPTLAIANSISFANVPDATRDFPSLRVLGTIGWIAVGIAVSVIFPKDQQATNKPLLLAAGLSGVLGLFSFALPHTPPSRKSGDPLPFLKAFKLLLEPSFGIFFAISFVITIALAFYYTFAGNFLESVGVKSVAAVMTIGQGSEIVFLLMLPLALKKFGMKGVLVVGMAAWAVRYGLFAIGAPYLLVLAGIALHGVCFDFFLAAGFIYTDNSAPSDIRGSAQALFSFLTYGVGMWIGNLVSGKVVDACTVNGVVNWHRTWTAPAIGAAVCLVIFLLLWREKKPLLHGPDGAMPRVDPVAETAASTDRANVVSQTID